MKESTIEPTLEIEDITPLKAQKYLGKNYEYNRNKRAKVIETYAKDMKQGRWRWHVAPPIVFDKDGRLIDGQHRLEAVVKSGKTIKSYVVRGAEEDDYKVIDSGIGRKAADGLKQYPQAVNLAVAARAYLNWDCGERRIFGKSENIRWSNQDIVDYVESHPFIHEYVREAYRCYDKIGTPMKMMSVFVRNIYEANPETAQGFMEALVSGIGLRPQDPAYVVREQLLNESMRKRRDGYSYPSESAYCWLVKAFNDYASGKTHKRYTHPINEEIPDVKAM